jgi:hypothetical protein
LLVTSNQNKQKLSSLLLTNKSASSSKVLKDVLVKEGEEEGRREELYMSHSLRSASEAADSLLRELIIPKDREVADFVTV